ncbi:MAG: hypothetical protein EXS69_00385 [Candidatus Zambryskibacteria bacterium]|nr:hypothetical protein [Candidatus Zambryskibacteria bacterium]
MKVKLLFYSFAAVVAVAIAHKLGMIFYLYWTTFWFDNFSHLLGGLSMGLFAFWIFRNLCDFKNPLSFRMLAMFIFFLVIIIGVGWEVFEYIYDIADPQGGETYWQDTTYDLFADSLGAIIASIIIYKNKLYA